jgi:hypothetical protein
MFTDLKGTIFIVETISSKSVKEISCNKTEEEVILLPYTYFEVIAVTDLVGKPLEVKLKEMPVP